MDRQQQLREMEQQAGPAAPKEMLSQLSTLRNDISNLTLKKSSTSEKLEETQQQLETKKTQLASQAAPAVKKTTPTGSAKSGSSGKAAKKK